MLLEASVHLKLSLATATIVAGYVCRRLKVVSRENGESMLAIIFGILLPSLLIQVYHFTRLSSSYRESVHLMRVCRHRVKSLQNNNFFRPALEGSYGPLVGPQKTRFVLSSYEFNGDARCAGFHSR